MRTNQRWEVLAVHVGWLGAIAATVAAAATLLEVPGLLIPICLLAASFVASVIYLGVMFHSARRWFVLPLVAALFVYIGLRLKDLTAIHIEIAFITGGPFETGDEAVRFAVEVTNLGKPTGLRPWNAELTTEDGRTFKGEPLRSAPAGLEIQSQDGSVTRYAYPDCDLRIETTKALQTGDIVYGIAEFLFRGYRAQQMPLDTKVRLWTTDLYGHTLSSNQIAFRDVASKPRKLFPCREATSAPAQP